uniref:Uncharacterized protein n=1 Tax=Anguilla anguilla TaxID=7936 RepID=A0A0E9PBS5_ANGAN
MINRSNSTRKIKCLKVNIYKNKSINLFRIYYNTHSE